jgi:predicted NAD/FAD-dependent oxidoreductase
MAKRSEQITKTLHTDVLIVGAGLSGLMAARVLQKRGRRVTVVDKGRSVGGRLATRRIGPGRADHGAQFFTVRSPKFRAWTEKWLAEETIFQWSTGWSDGSLVTAASPDSYPRYAVRGGMNNLAKRLAKDLDTRVNVRIQEVRPIENGWQVRSEDGRLYTSQALLLTPPVPQSLALLDTGGTCLSSADRQALERVEYAPCMAGLFWVDGSVQLPEPGAVQSPEAPVSWIANNRQKGISPDADIVTVHAGPAHSRLLWNETEAAALSSLQSALQPFLDPIARIIEAQLKRWRYAMPTTIHSDPCLLASGLSPLVFAGDAFGGPRVEGAALSGLAAAAAIEFSLSTSQGAGETEQNRPNLTQS